ncbi:MAG: helix-turn-helix domain-containing protein [Salinivirgaceae bacterium]
MKNLFNISRIGPAEALQMADSGNQAYQSDYETLIVGMQGELEHFVDFKSGTIQAPLVSFVARCKAHRVLPKPVNGQCDMWFIHFKSEFIAETIFQLYTTYHNNANIDLQTGACFNRLNAVCSIINDEMQQPIPDLSIVRHLLSALFIMIESERKKVAHEGPDRNAGQNETYINFMKILEENYRRPLGVEFYAEKLFMSARNLNLICQNIMNQSVSEMIETRKLTEAKNLLTTTQKSISEIGFELGYNEKSYFSNVFKKKTGQTPTEFREEMRKLL